MTEAVQIITEDDLLKSIKDLEEKAGEGEDPKPKIPEVAKVVLAKSTGEALREGASPATKKALDVSDVLTDLVGLMGKYNDDALSTLQKSVNAGAERDLAIVTVLVDLKKSIDEMSGRLERYGAEPRTPRSATTDEVLHKSAPNGGGQRLDPRTAKRTITQGLEILAKSFQPNDPKFMDIAQAAIRFEATGQIEERYIAAAQKALAAPAA